MYRLLLAVVGLVQLAAPDWVVYAYTRLAYERPEAFRVRSWVPIAIRLEGILMLWLAVRGEEGDRPPGRAAVERAGESVEVR